LTDLYEQNHRSTEPGGVDRQKLVFFVSHHLCQLLDLRSTPGLFYPGQRDKSVQF
jgi:hypothetical protein